ncbi:hypothetical protein Nepgr_005176 [Nepenthes gracilis]|uniref:Uncharacterized protein n=1 Tax=Nepenthes gracilis TaxID=150966 RepID=A0AAD3S2P3_NEPGR|nr:hypothetical protein Nepgr_005176 [Nepenthes gracilis]
MPSPLTKFFTHNCPNVDAILDSENLSDGFLLTNKDQNKAPVLITIPPLQGLNNSDPAALVVDHTSDAVSHNKGKHPLLSTDDFVQSDAKLENKKIEALHLISRLIELFSGFALWWHIPPRALEKNSDPPPQDQLGWWCIHATINSSSLEDHIGCKASTETDEDGAILQISLVAIAFAAGHYLLYCWSCQYITIVCTGDTDVYEVMKFSQLERQGSPYQVGSFTWFATPGPSLQRAKSWTSEGNKGAVLNVPANFTTIAGRRHREAESKAFGQPGAGNGGPWKPDASGVNHSNLKLFADVDVVKEAAEATMQEGELIHAPEGNKKFQQQRGCAARQRVTLRLLTSWCDIPWVKMEAIETMMAPTLGTLIPVIGASGFVAAASAVGTVAGSIAIATSFGAELFEFQTDIE